MQAGGKLTGWVQQPQVRARGSGTPISWAERNRTVTGSREENKFLHLLSGSARTTTRAARTQVHEGGFVEAILRPLIPSDTTDVVLDLALVK